MLDPQEVIKNFRVSGDVKSCKPFVRGHINTTYICELKSDTARKTVVLQKINKEVFKDPPGIMKNIMAVSEYLTGVYRQQGEGQTLNWIAARDGMSYFLDESGEYWRCADFIENTSNFDKPESSTQLYAAAKFLGQFHTDLSSFDVGSLSIPIAGFQDVAGRFFALDTAISDDVAGRVGNVGKEIEECQRLQAFVESYYSEFDSLPLRVTHGDAKFNNFLFAENENEVVALIDLDTLMPGTLAYDFGDFVWPACSVCGEDETNLSLVNVDAEFVEVCCRAYLETASSILTDNERKSLSYAPRLISTSISVRFLTDYLNGDVYFATQRENQNLDRARVQLGLAACFEELQDSIQSWLGT